MKKCAKCGVEKPLSDYAKDKYRPLGLSSACKKCAKEYREAIGKPAKDKQWREANRAHLQECNAVYRKKHAEEIRAKRLEYYLANRADILAKRREHRRLHPEAYTSEAARKTSTAKNRRKNGFSADLFTTVFHTQGGCCAICKTNLASLPSHRVHADHCHETKKPRGILCGRCNAGLGLFDDAPEKLAAAINYLSIHGKKL